ncbi:asparaginase, partial [Burkholderia sp. SIMBA_052]|uniref:asparaginase n=1 Tax=Burkholderia sp. SIMBA_052 TaxID=3085793 RepID=UPI00397BE32A
MSVAATVYRGDVVENTHIAHVAVVDTEGALLYSYGDPSRFTLVRSCPIRRAVRTRTCRGKTSVRVSHRPSR